MKASFRSDLFALIWLRSRPRLGLQVPLMVAALVCSPVSGATDPSDLSTWRAQRLESLTAPDSWLTLIGRHWVAVGDQTIGTAEDNNMVLTRGPRRLGVITLDQKTGEVFLIPDAEVQVAVDGGPAHGKIQLTDTDKKLTFPDAKPFTLQVLVRSSRKVLRVKDPNAETRTHFAGLSYFPDETAWRIEAKWEAFSPPRTLKIQNIIGTVSDETVPGKAVFERDGKVYELWPIQEAGDDELFFVFADQTSGKETYGGGRFLYAEAAKDGKVVLDFNRAINPPCAFTLFATCPLPPAQNRLATPITAGEKAPAAHP